MNILNQISYLYRKITKSSTPPRGWNRTIEDLTKEMNEGKRTFIGQPEIDWAREYNAFFWGRTFNWILRKEVY